MVAVTLVLADAAEEGKDIILSMLVVGLVIIAVIALGELFRWGAVQSRRAKANRPL